MLPPLKTRLLTLPKSLSMKTFAPSNRAPRVDSIRAALSTAAVTPTLRRVSRVSLLELNQVNSELAPHVEFLTCSSAAALLPQKWC